MGDSLHFLRKVSFMCREAVVTPFCAERCGEAGRGRGEFGGVSLSQTGVHLSLSFGALCDFL